MTATTKESIDFKFETDSVEQANLEFTKSSLPQIYGFKTPLSYDAQHAEIVGDQRGFDPKMKAHEFAMLTIKENGSARRGYKSISDARTFKVGMHIGARCGDDLIVSDVTEDNKLVHPAKLSLLDVIGYERLILYK